MARRISESPASVTQRTPTPKYLPQAVPNSTLSKTINKIAKKKHTARKVVDLSVRQHAIIFNFGFNQRRYVVGKNNKLG